MPEDATVRRRKNRADAATGAARPKRAALSKRTSGRAKDKADIDVRELIFLVSRVAADFETFLKTKKSALSLSQWAMLEMLSQEDGTIRPSQIARRLGFSRQLVRQATKKLLSLDLIAKDAPAEGKKAVGIMLRNPGRKVLAEIGTTTLAMSETLKAEKQDGSVGQAVRTLKNLSAAIPATNDDRREKTGKKARETPIAEVAEA